MAQRATFTFFNRHPDIFAVARMWAEQRFGPSMKGGALRILSFGCSDGSELQTLRCYFPDASIFGCDVNEERLEEAHQRAARSGVVFDSSAVSIAQHGPYDIVFAMSVLCRDPLKGKEISQAFPFAEFANLTGQISDALRPGGLFCLYNSSYFFDDLPFQGKFRPVRSRRIATNGFVPKFDPAGQQVTTRVADGGFTRHVVRDSLGSYDDESFRDCLFEKVDVVRVAFEDAAMPGPEGPMRLVDERWAGAADEPEGRGLLYARLHEELFVDTAGDHWMRREWHKTTLKRTTAALGAWWTQASADQIDQFRPPIPATIDVSVPRGSEAGVKRRWRLGRPFWTALTKVHALWTLACLLYV